MDTVLITDISIHTPRGGSDVSRSDRFTLFRYFNPRSPWGERLGTNSPGAINILFQSTLPVGGATLTSLYLRLQILFQSTLPVGGATINASQSENSVDISIHAPRGGSDLH